MAILKAIDHMVNCFIFLLIFYEGGNYMKIECANKYYIRICRLPFNEYINTFCSNDLESIKRYYLKNFQTDIFIGAKNLYNQIERNTFNEDTYISLLKYMIRASTRCTPLGSFSGIGQGSFCEKENLKIDERIIYPNVDYEWLTQFIPIAETLLGDKLLVILNNTLLVTTNKIYNLWVSCYSKEDNFNNKHISIDKTKAIEIIMNMAKTYISKKQLYKELKKYYRDLSKKTFDSFFSILLNNEILVSNVRNSFYNKDPMKNIIDILKNNGIYNNELVTKLNNFNKNISPMILNESSLIKLNKLDKTLTSVVKTTSSLKYDSRVIGKFNLNKSIQSEINEYLVFLYNYSEHKYGYEKSVNNFRDLFNDAFIPFETAISYITGIGIPNKLMNKANCSKIEDYFFNLNKKDVIDISNIPTKEKKNINCMHQYGGEIAFNILKDKDNYIYVTNSLIGSTLKRESIGRFSYMFNNIAENEDDNSKIDNVIIRYLPKKSKISNVLGSIGNDYILEYGFISNKNEEKTINLNDVLIGIVNNKFMFKNRKNGRYITFFTNDKVNTSFMPKKLQFLVEASKELLPDIFQLNRDVWTIADKNKITPRICYKNFIVLPKCWNLYNILKTFDINNFEQFCNVLNDIRTEYKIPKYIYAENGDQRILLNLDIISHLKILYNLEKNKKMIKLYENFVSNNLLLRDEFGNGYIGEFVFQFSYLHNNFLELQGNEYNQIVNKRFYQPFDEYVTLRINIESEYENDFLSYIIYPKIKEMKNNNKFTFFFVRYKDNRSDHLRLRFHFLEDRFISAILNLCKEIKSSGYEISYEFLPYNRELERYGDDKIVFFEEIFDITTQIIFEILDMKNKNIFNFSLETYYIILILMLLDDFNYSKRYDLFHEFKLNKKEQKRYINLKKSVLALFETGEIGELMQSVEGMKIYEMYDDYSLLLIKNWNKIITDSKDYVADQYILSLFHMTFNRLIGINRKKEIEIMGVIEGILYSLENKQKYSRRLL